MTRRSLTYTSFLAFLLLVLSASVGFAQESEDQDSIADPSIEQIKAAAEQPQLQSNVFDSGPIVRRKLLYRSTRFELTPFFGVTINDGYTRNIIPGINLNYHLTNDIAISASFGYGVLDWSTDLKNNLVKELSGAGSRGEKALKNLDFMRIQLFADLGLAYVPMYGKFSLFGVATVNWDFHIVAGVTVVKEQGYNAYSRELRTDSTLNALRPGGLVQAGVRFFAGDFVSINLDVRNLIYSSSELTRGNEANASITNRVLLSLGVSFFFPTDVKVSW